MAVTPSVAVVENMLQFIGVFVSFSIAFVSYRGMKRTDSPTLLRLTTAFAFLGLGFTVEGLVGLGAILPGLAGLTTTLVIMGLLLETMGYFFLAFSHAVDVMVARRLGIALAVFPVISISGTQMTNVLSILSFYFVAYGVVETLFAYKANKRPATLLIAGGLSFIAVGTFVQWLSLLYTPVNILPLFEILLKETGLMLLFVPVLTFGREKAIGTI